MWFRSHANIYSYYTVAVTTNWLVLPLEGPASLLLVPHGPSAPLLPAGLLVPRVPSAPLRPAGLLVPRVPAARVLSVPLLPDLLVLLVHGPPVPRGMLERI